MPMCSASGPAPSTAAVGSRNPAPVGQAAPEQLGPPGRVGLVPGGQPVGDALAEHRGELVGRAGEGQGGQGVPPAGHMGQGRLPGGQAGVAQVDLGPVGDRRQGDLHGGGAGRDGLPIALVAPGEDDPPGR
jgi:hypothetical protein